MLKYYKYFLFIWLGLIFCAHGYAQTSTYGKLQAAYVYNFAKYIKWPNNFEVFNISVLGETEITEDLKAVLKNKKASGKEIALNVINTLEEAKDINILYVPSSRSRDLPYILKTLEGKNVLVLTEEDLARKGATISFIMEDDKLGFKINKNVLIKAGLTVSEGLLKMAVII
ncbi:MAG: YfiR family protein [Bacteroidetes bacterium]|nr:YfiR family protein [Bacteroidota bacterium]